MTALPANQTTVADLVEEYEAKCAGVERAIADFEAAFDRLQLAATVQGTFVEPIGSKSYLYADRIRDNLLKSGWRAIYKRLNIDHIVSAKDRLAFERAFADPAPLTLDNARATFGDYLMRPRFHILRGMAEVFTSLDPAYKSHSKVKIGVKGLPKRVILTNWGGIWGSYGRDKFRDICNALAAYRDQPRFEHLEMLAIEQALKHGDAVLDGKSVQWVPYDAQKGTEPIGVDRGMTVRGFANGNAHVFFDKWALLDINRALAEFYGDVLPDAEPENVKPSASTAVSKDLQFYRSPAAVVAQALEFAGISDPKHYRGEAPRYRVLEPSCGDGAMLDELARRGCSAFGIEYHPGRASEARAKGHRVLTANFLEQSPTGDFDKVVMNPPFYGRHYVRHVRHALGFLRPGGVLVAVLPATAQYDHGELEGQWCDLPVASFAESGTNVPTCLLRMVRKDG